MFNLMQNQENANQLKVLIKSRIQLLLFYAKVCQDIHTEVFTVILC